MRQSTEYWAQTSNIFATKLSLKTAANKEPLFPITNLLQTTQTQEITVPSYHNQPKTIFIFI
jgi:hypothetical protein